MPDGSRSFEPADGGDPSHLRRLAALYREHHAFVWRVLRRCGIPEAELDDAVQEVFIVVHRRLSDFEGRASDRTWLYAVAVRVASTLRRSARREDARRETAGASMHASFTLDPEVELSRAQAVEILYSLLDELDDKKRTVFVLAELEGVRVPEISRILGVNPRTIHSRLRLARDSFRSALQRYQAQQAGQHQRSQLKLSRLRRAEQARHVRPSRAAWAALAVRIQDGALPLLGGWTPAAVTSASSFVTPLVTTLVAGLAIAGVGAVALSTTVRPTAESTTVPQGESVAAATVSPAVATVPRPVAAPQRDQRAATSIATDGPKTGEPKKSEGKKSEPKTGEPKKSEGKKSEGRTPPTASLARLGEETAVLERARQALSRSEPETALRTLSDYSSQHPAAFLAKEFDSTRVRALCAAGRRGEAESFSLGHPNRQRVFAATCH